MTNYTEIDLQENVRPLADVLDEAKKRDLAPRSVRWNGNTWEVEFDYHAGYSTK